jgi:hypothetical protein
MALDPEISMLITEMDANLSHLESITHGVTEDRFRWRPDPSRWSMGECIAHLNIVNGGSLESIETGIKKGHASGKTGEGPFQYGFLSRKFIASQEPPVEKKYKAPKVFLPPSELKMAETLAEYRRIGGELKRLAREANGLHLVKVKVIMPALPAALRAIVRMPLGGRLVLITTHDRRHLWQAEQVRNDAGFPS